MSPDAPKPREKFSDLVARTAATVPEWDALMEAAEADLARQLRQDGQNGSEPTDQPDA